jgi:hypothetical protein
LTLVTGIACSCDVFIYIDKTDRHNIHVTEILLKVALNTITITLTIYLHCPP